ncbi:MAG: aminotransferase class I/II-fold pyridoxal phosphate-dependent enzyme [Halodesulfurarchaeum sp.]
MDIEPFELERWFARYEHGAEIMLAESGIRSLSADRFDLDPGRLGYVIPTNGDPAFRAQVGERYDRGPDSVLFTVGTQEANLLAFQALLDEGDHAVVITPTYQALHAVPEALASVTRVPLQPPDWKLDPDRVAAAMEPNTRLIVLNNPNNPTGRYHPLERVEALYDLAAENEAYLLADEVYRLLADDTIPPVASMGEWGLSSSSLTKAFGLAGLRFGWLVGPADVIEAAWQWKDYTTISPTKIGQYVARQALGEQETDILEANRALADRNRSRVGAFVEEQDLDWHEPVGVNGFITVPGGFDSSRAFCREVVETESVVLAPGDVFGFDGYFRLGFGLPTDELEAGLGRLENVLGR